MTQLCAATLNHMVDQEARTIAYNGDDRVMTFVVIPGHLLWLLVPRREPGPAPAPAVGDWFSPPSSAHR